MHRSSAQMRNLPSKKRRVLHLASPAAALGSFHITALANLTALQKLTIQLPPHGEASWWADPAAALISALSKLPALQLLELSGSPGAPSEAMPTVVKLAALQASSLTALSCSLASPPGGTLALNALPALESCELTWVPDEDSDIVVTGASFSGAAGITQLTLSGNGVLRLAPHCFSGLSKLAELYLSVSGRTLISAVTLSGVGRSLRRLDLSLSSNLQLPVDCLSGLSGLEELSLSFCGLKAVPAALSGVASTLRRLILAENPELQLQPKCFAGLEALRELDLSDCGLGLVTEAMLSGLGGLQRLEMGE